MRRSSGAAARPLLASLPTYIHTPVCHGTADSQPAVGATATACCPLAFPDQITPKIDRTSSLRHNPPSPAQQPAIQRCCTASKTIEGRGARASIRTLALRYCAGRHEACIPGQGVPSQPASPPPRHCGECHCHPNKPIRPEMLNYLFGSHYCGQFTGAQENKGVTNFLCRRVGCPDCSVTGPAWCDTRGPGHALLMRPTCRTWLPSWGQAWT